LLWSTGHPPSGQSLRTPVRMARANQIMHRLRHIGRSAPFIGVIGTLLSILLALVIWEGLRRRWSQEESKIEAAVRSDIPEPRFRNTSPCVCYVGDEACSHCHPQIAESYQNHPMARSSAPARDVLHLEHFQKTNRDPFEASGFWFSIEPRGESEYHKTVRRDTEGK